MKMQNLCTQCKSIPLLKITTDKARFQPRDNFSEAKVLQIVENFNPILFKNLIVWQEKSGGKYYVLAGHHRLEALKRMNYKNAPCVVFKGDFKSARNLAFTENASGRVQSAAENAKVLRILRKEGKNKQEVKEESKKNFNDSSVSVDLSYLTDNSKVFQDLKTFKPNTDTYKETETMAQWLGKTKQEFPLSKPQENQAYTYLRANFKTVGRKFRSSAEWSEFFNRVISKQFKDNFKPNAAIRFEQNAPTSQDELQYEEELAKLEAETCSTDRKIEKLISKRKDFSTEKFTEMLEKLLSEYKTSKKRYVMRKEKLPQTRAEKNEKQETMFNGLHGVTAKTSKQKQKYFRLKSPIYKRLIKKMTNPFRLLIWGEPGQGKTTVITRFIAKELRREKILWFSSEEEVSMIQERFRLMKIRNKNIRIMHSNKIEDLESVLRNNKFTVVVVDSVNWFFDANRQRLQAVDITSIRHDYPETSFIWISQVTKDNRYKGDTGIAHDSTINLTISKNMIVQEKNKFGETGNYFNVSDYR